MPCLVCVLMLSTGLGVSGCRPHKSRPPSPADHCLLQAQVDAQRPDSSILACRWLQPRPKSLSETSGFLSPSPPSVSSPWGRPFKVRHCSLRSGSVSSISTYPEEPSCQQGDQAPPDTLPRGTSPRPLQPPTPHCPQPCHCSPLPRPSRSIASKI